MKPVQEMTVFVEVVRCGSFVAASHRLGMTSSGVSRRISRFEERLGVRLLNRTTRTLSLTEAGTVLYESSESIISAVEKAEETVVELGSKPKGLLRVSASDAMSVQVIVPFLSSFSNDYPDVRVQLVQGDGSVSLVDERIDVGIVFGQPRETSFVARKLVDDPWVVCAAPDYISQHGMPETPADLHNHRCLTIHARGKTTDQWDFVVEGEPEIQSIESVFSGIGLTVKLAALNGLGIARLAHFLVRPEIEAGTLVPLLTSYMPDDDRAIYAVYSNRKYLPSKARVFIDRFHAHISETLAPPGG